MSVSHASGISQSQPSTDWWRRVTGEDFPLIVFEKIKPGDPEWSNRYKYMSTSDTIRCVIESNLPRR
jgi:hypothetical protein